MDARAAQEMVGADGDEDFGDGSVASHGSDAVEGRGHAAMPDGPCGVCRLMVDRGRRVCRLRLSEAGTAGWKCVRKYSIPTTRRSVVAPGVAWKCLGCLQSRGSSRQPGPPRQDADLSRAKPDPGCHPEWWQAFDARPDRPGRLAQTISARACRTGCRPEAVAGRRVGRRNGRGVKALIPRGSCVWREKSRWKLASEPCLRRLYGYPCGFFLTPDPFPGASPTVSTPDP